MHGEDLDAVERRIGGLVADQRLQFVDEDVFETGLPVAGSVRGFFFSGEKGGWIRLRETRAGLGRATPFLRARLAEQLQLKKLPQLTFTFVGLTCPA